VQILGALDASTVYVLPSAVFITCYLRIFVVIRQRQIKVSHGTTAKAFNASSCNASPAGTQKQQSQVNKNDAPSDTIDSAINNATTPISRKQMNVLQTMILITTSFVILWMPAALTVLLVYFEVRHFSLN
jgi:hypothetical protein